MTPQRRINGPVLRAIRERRGLRSSQVADAIGVSRPFYLRLERGDRISHKPETAARISEVLKVSANRFTVPVARQQKEAA